MQALSLSAIDPLIPNGKNCTNAMLKFYLFKVPLHCCKKLTLTLLTLPKFLKPPIVSIKIDHFIYELNH